MHVNTISPAVAEIADRTFACSGIFVVRRTV